MKTNEPCFETSPLLQQIREAINSNAPFQGTLRVSVADEPRWERSSSGDEVLVRWACWNLETDGMELTEPILTVLSETVTRERLTNELPMLFPDLEVKVDNEIDVPN